MKDYCPACQKEVDYEVEGSDSFCPICGRTKKVAEASVQQDKKIGRGGFNIKKRAWAAFFTLIILFIIGKLILNSFIGNFQKDISDNPLFTAVITHNYDEALILINEGADINARIGPTNTTILMQASRAGDVDSVKLLLQNGADPNLKDTMGWAALHHTAIPSKKTNHSYVAKLLLESGADINIKDNKKRTPLHRAAQYGYKESVILFLEYGADPNAIDYNGWTPADRGARYPEIVALLK